jgi:hypothetical protein
VLVLYHMITARAVVSLGGNGTRRQQRALAAVPAQAVRP